MFLYQNRHAWECYDLRLGLTSTIYHHFMVRLPFTLNIPECSPNIPQKFPQNNIWGTLGNRPKCSPKQHLGNWRTVPIPQDTDEELGNYSCPPKNFSGTGELFLFSKKLFSNSGTVPVTPFFGELGNC